MYVLDDLTGSNYLGDTTCGMSGDLRYFSVSKGRNDNLYGGFCGKSQCLSSIGDNTADYYMGCLVDSSITTCPAGEILDSYYRLCLKSPCDNNCDCDASSPCVSCVNGSYMSATNPNVCTSIFFLMH